MIGRRAAAAGIATKLGNHSFRATGITAYLKNGGTLEKAAAISNHAMRYSVWPLVMMMTTISPSGLDAQTLALRCSSLDPYSPPLCATSNSCYD
jgi:hypothetical protein